MALSWIPRLVPPIQSSWYPNSADFVLFCLVKENLKPMNGRIKEPQESLAELMNQLQSLKQDLNNWKSKLDAQVKIYRD
ncbi:hypothetical protein Droror1_Dr00016494, partial [Drosera rotundifolia]